jgi:bifunctional NMN adenylyltransferase/nudix hydrolase
MNNKEYELVVYIGRFQPFHIAHQETIKRGFELADNVLVLIGSAYGARSIRNPFSFHERVDFISNAFYDEYYTSKVAHSLDIAASRDFTYDINAWIMDTNKIVAAHALDQGIDPAKIAIIGHDKDTTSFYLNHFPQWAQEEMPAFPPVGDTIDATKIRRLMFEKNYHFLKGVLPNNVYADLFHEPAWVHQEAGLLMQAEWDDDKIQREKWAGSPYPVQFVTTDAAVIQSGHILLVKRAGFPGQGLWAMPGGFVEFWERVRPSVLRELFEETRIKVPIKVLDRAIDGYEMFDDPERSTRGRTISHTYRITLDPTQKLPKVKGDGTETFEAKWVTFAEFDAMEGVMFEDHYHILKHMLAQSARAIR